MRAEGVTQCHACKMIAHDARARVKSLAHIPVTRVTARDTPYCQPARFTLTFSAPAGTNGDRAIKMLLKYALRACGLRCIAVETDDAPPRGAELGCGSSRRHNPALFVPSWNEFSLSLISATMIASCRHSSSARNTRRWRRPTDCRRSLRRRCVKVQRIVA